MRRASLACELVRREGKSAYLRSDNRDHTLVYFEGDPRDHTTGFEVTSSRALAEAADVLERSGRPVERGTAQECEARYVDEFIRFKDLTGNPIELVVRPLASGWRYFPMRDAGITGFSHIGLRSSDARRDEAFWTDVLGARVSDRIGVAPLLRIDAVHHKIALFPSTYAGVQHVNHQVESIDDLMRSWYWLQEQRHPDRVRARPPSHLRRALPVLRRTGRHGVRVFDGRPAHCAGGGGDLSSAPVSVRAQRLLHVGIEAADRRVPKLTT